MVKIELQKRGENFLVNMAQRLRSRTTPTLPPLREVLARIEYASPDVILREFNATRKHFKDDVESILSFWLSELLDVTFPPHQILLGHLFAFTGLSHTAVVSFLDTIASKSILDSLHITRVRGTNGVHYRIRVGSAI